ncbi:MAG: CDP-alcohol phosphatidyltransferase family protein [Syntrophobacterales bacterium]
MSIYAYIFQESAVRLWELSSRQRLERVLERAGATEIVENLESIPKEGSALLLRGDYLYDDRVIKSLAKMENVVLQVSSAQAVAAHVMSNLAQQARDVLSGAASSEDLKGVRVETPETLSSSFDERLRKVDPVFVLPISSENRRDLEKLLFSWSYKGVTDLVTKWVWPRPARWATGVCARYGFRPNHVTIASLLLVVIAGIFFFYGIYGWGLLVGWLMTFLDTVDGKLARVTVTSSRFGDIFDHAIDLIHPPLWYIAWGLGLTQFQPAVPGLTLNTMLWLIVVGYIVGRLVELTFKLRLGNFGIFCWRPTDSYFRLITGRRNPNLILLTISAVLGRPDLGLEAVAIWTVLTSLFLLLRLVMAWHERNISGPLRTWLQDIGQGIDKRSLAVRLFTRQSTTSRGSYE